MTVIAIHFKENKNPVLYSGEQSLMEMVKSFCEKSGLKYKDQTIYEIPELFSDDLNNKFIKHLESYGFERVYMSHFKFTNEKLPDVVKVKLMDQGSSKLKTVRAVKDLSGLGLRDSKNVVDNLDIFETYASIKEIDATLSPCCTYKIVDLKN